MNNAIKLAIEKGGYDVEAGYQQERSVGDRDRFALQDPLFWQALGKALGWTQVCSECGIKQEPNTFRGDFKCNCSDPYHSLLQNEWNRYAHQYLDVKFEDQLHVEHTGKTEDEFWKELLNKNV